MALPRFSLTTKVVGMSGVLLLLMAASLLYLTLKIGAGTALVADQHRLAEKQAGLIGRQHELVGQQSREARSQTMLAEEQAALTGRQRKLAQRQRRFMEAQADALAYDRVVADLFKAFYSMRYWLTDYSITWRAESAVRAEELRRVVEDRLTLLEHMDAVDLDIIDRVNPIVETYVGLMTDAVNAFLVGDRDAGIQRLARSREYGERVLEHLDKLMRDSDDAVIHSGKRIIEAADQVTETAMNLEHNASRVQEVVKRATDAGEKVKHAGDQVNAAARHVRESGTLLIRDNRRVYNVSLTLFVVAIVVGTGLAWLFARAIVLPIRHLGRAMGDIAEERRDLSERLDETGDDEIGQLAAAFNRMLHSLTETTVSRAYMTDVIQSMNETLVVVDGDRRIAKVNESLARLLDYREDELIGEPLAKILSNAKVERLIVRSPDAGQGLSGIETSYSPRNGKAIPMLLSAAAIRGDAGRHQGWVCVAQDITQRKAAERATRESEGRFRDFTESASDWYWEMDEKLRFTYFSKRFFEVTGVAPDKLLGKTREETGIPDVDPQAWRKHLDDLSSRRAFRGFVHPRIKNGEQVWVSINGTPIIDEDGHFKGYRGTGTDVTARERAKQDLIHAKEQSEAAARARSDFLANMSHEIRTPMNGVLGMLDLLADSPLNYQQKEFVDVAINSGSALLSLINDILDLSKIEAGKLDLETIDFDLRTTVEDVVELLAERAHSRGLALACLISAGVPPMVRGDPNRLRQILTNLIANAVKFTEEGEVVVRVNDVVETSDGLKVRIEVTDSGIGIAPGVQGQIFETFTQADGSTTRKYGGTGLGLTISKQLVERMGGEIGVDSTPGEGSTFWFTVMLHPAETVGVALTPHRGLSGLNVLIVDDNETNRLVLERQLDSWRMRFTSVAGAADAIKRLRAAAAELRPFQLVLLDMMMQEMDGLELARRIRADDLLRDLKLILLTSLARRGQGASAQSAGIHGYLTKPVRQGQLYDCIATVMGMKDPDAELVTRHRIAEHRDRERQRVLVVEDNHVNQMVALGLLRKLGFRVQVADDGRAALEALKLEHYDLVLMDCQMPGLDGYEACARIRASVEPYADIPIIAVTANAMEGDAEQCLAAGMNDYLAKPVKAEALEEMLNRWLPHAGGAITRAFSAREVSSRAPGTEDAGSGAAHEPRSALDENVLVALHDVLGRGLAEVVDVFLQEAPGQVDALTCAAERGDAEHLVRTTHALKSSSSNLGALGLSELCRSLETDARERRLEAAVERVAQIRVELERVSGEFDRRRGENLASVGVD